MTSIARWGAALLLALSVATPAGAAHAIPDDGAGANTPGTSSSVAPRALRAGDTLRFTVSGFPAGETVYIKIDDGQSCSAAAVHGACVQHLQRISAAGTVSGSFQLPGDIKPGKHWLRFLASAEVRDASGAYQGIKGYTRRSPEFTVTAGSGTSDSGSSNSSNGGNDSSPDTSTSPDTQAPGAATSTEAGAPQNAEADQALVAPRMASPSDAPSDAPSTAAASTDAETGTETDEQADTRPAASASVAPADDDHVPYLGAGALVLCLLASAWLLVRGRRVALRG